MKTKTLFYMALMAVMTTLAACSQDDELQNAAPKPAQIEFEIFDGGYGGDATTRVKEEGIRTKFEAGDECALYIIDKDEFIACNVKLTAEEGENGEITWKAADGAISGVTENSKYFLRYPYLEIQQDVLQVGDVDTEVFSNHLSELGHDWYQDTYAQYTNCDVMTATGTASKDADGKLKVSFSLTHRMALAVIEVPRTVYKFEGTSIPDYTVASSVDFSSSEYRPLRMDVGTYRFVFNPEFVEDEHDIIGTINGSKQFTIPAKKLKEDIAKGTYKIFRIGGANATIEKKHTLQVGDYLMKDGNLISKGTSLTDEQKENVAAIVFSAGHHDLDNSDYSETGIGSAQCHGYAVALKDAEKCTWNSSNEYLGCYSDNGEDDWNGYYYTWNIIIPEAGSINWLDGYPATNKAVKYNRTVAPACSSGWFLPAIGQMKEIYSNRENLFRDNILCHRLADDYYWSSSESDNQGINVKTIEIISGENYSIHDSAKNNEYYVRPVLAF